MNELEHLKIHMQKGCLSDIPNKFGTNRNENLHRSINHCLAGHRLGVELAIALISVFFYSWNQKRNGERNNSIIYSLLRNSMTNTSTSLSRNTCFGIGTSGERKYSEQQLGTAFSCTQNVAKAMQILKLIGQTEHSPKESSCDSILEVLQCALSHLMLEESLDNLSKSHPKISRPSSMKMISHFSKQGMLVQEETVHSRCLANILDSFQLDSIEIEKDGNCLFSSIATYLLLYQTSLSGCLLEHMQIIGLSSTMSTSKIVERLRELLVHEWLTFKHVYYPFFAAIIPECDYEAETKRFLHSGFFSSNLGDAMLYGLSSVLQLPLVVFTSIENWPHMTIHPRNNIPVDSTPILLSFLHSGPGHYSLVTQKNVDPSFNLIPTPTQDNIPHENVSCRCGRGRNASKNQKLNCSKSSCTLVEILHCW